jgi:hypothetical protein
MFHLAFLQSYQADREIEKRRFQFSGRRTGTTRRRVPAQRDAFKFMYCEAFDRMRRKDAAQSL